MNNDPPTCYCSVTFSCKELRTVACMLMAERQKKVKTVDEWEATKARSTLLCMLIFAHRNIAVKKQSGTGFGIQNGYTIYLNAEDRFISQMMLPQRMDYAPRQQYDGD